MKNKFMKKALGGAAALLMVMSFPMQSSFVYAAEEQMAVQDYVFGSQSVELDAGSQYRVPVSLMNSKKINNPSMAASCVQSGSLELKDNGDAYLTVNLGPVTVGELVGWSSDWKVYSSCENYKDSEKTDAEVLGVDEEGNTTAIRFKLPYTDQDGVYVNMAVKAMNMSPDGYLKIDFANAEKIEETEPEANLEGLEDGTYKVQGSMMKTNKKDASMSDRAIDHGITIEVEEGSYTVNMEFTPLDMGSGMVGYLGGLDYFKTGYTTNEYGVPEGEYEAATIKSYYEDEDGNRISDQYGTDYMKEVSFEMIPEAQKDNYVPLQVFVPIMETFGKGMGVQQAYLKLEADTLEKIADPVPDTENIPGWKEENGRWWYSYEDGSYASDGWKMIDGTWYYFGADGWMKTGWLLDGSTWYYLNAGGAMTTGWLLDGSTWYYFNADGTMATGWLLDGSTWYYFNAGGAMTTGWLLDGSTWYYFNAGGAMTTGWLLDGSTWYYFNAGGAMATGWVLDGSTWYYFHENGAMAVNQWIGDCYVNASGAWV